MSTSWSRIAIPALALALGACSAAKEEPGSLKVAVAALGGEAAKVYIQVTNGTDTFLLEATNPFGTADEWEAAIPALAAGTYPARAWGYSPEQVAQDAAIAPPAAARYETRGTLPTFTLAGGDSTFVRVVLTELVPDVTRHAPYSSFISVSAQSTYFGGAVLIRATGLDPDGDLATWRFSDGGKGSFSPAASGTFAGVDTGYSATWSPGAAATGDVEIFLTVTDAAGNASTVSIVITVGTSATFTAEIDAAPLVVSGLLTTDGQLVPNERTVFSSSFYDLWAEPLAATWTDDCGGVFENTTFDLLDPFELEGPTNPYVARAQFRTAVIPELEACYVTLTVTDTSGSTVTQHLGITVTDAPVVDVVP